MFQRSKSQSKNRVPPLLTSNSSGEVVGRWLRTHSPDVVVSHDDRGVEWLRQAGAVGPEQVRFVSLIRGGDPLITGIETFPEEIAAAAVNRLNQLLHDNKTDVFSTKV